MALSILSLLSLFALSRAGVIDPFFDPRIVNGEDAKIGEIPYQVSLQDPTGFHFCGGSVLNDNYVITAAHCVVDQSPGGVKVIAGTIDLKNPAEKHDVEKIIYHEQYSPADSWRNDIALLKVKVPFTKGPNIQHVPLPPKGHVVNANDVAVVSGWGRLWQGGPTTNALQRVNIYITDQDYCKSTYKGMGYNVHATQVCAHDPRTEKGSCHGDSGGPLTVGGKLVGLVSWANGCASITYPTVYTRVVSFLDWINANAV